MKFQDKISKILPEGSVLFKHNHNYFSFYMNPDDFENGKDFDTQEGNESLEQFIDRVIERLIGIEEDSKEHEPLVTIDYSLVLSESCPLRLYAHDGSMIPSDARWVGTGSKWDNPFSVNLYEGRYYVEDKDGNCYGVLTGYRIKRTAMAKAVECYSGWIDAKIMKKELDIRELTGQDLMCSCECTKPCHANVLIELANTKKL